MKYTKKIVNMCIFAASMLLFDNIEGSYRARKPAPIITKVTPIDRNAFTEALLNNDLDWVEDNVDANNIDKEFVKEATSSRTTQQIKDFINNTYEKKMWFDGGVVTGMALGRGDLTPITKEEREKIIPDTQVQIAKQLQDVSSKAQPKTEKEPIKPSLVPPTKINVPTPTQGSSSSFTPAKPSTPAPQQKTPDPTVIPEGNIMKPSSGKVYTEDELKKATIVIDGQAIDLATIGKKFAADTPVFKGFTTAATSAGDFQAGEVVKSERSDKTVSLAVVITTVNQKVIVLQDKKGVAYDPTKLFKHKPPLFLREKAGN